MKTFILLICLTLITFLSYCQITPFRFNTEKITRGEPNPKLSENLKNLEKTNPAAYEKISKDVKGFLWGRPGDSTKTKKELDNKSGSSFIKKDMYPYIQNSLLDYAKKEEDRIIMYYSLQQKVLIDSFPTLEKADVEELKSKLQANERRRKQELQNCEQIRNLAKEYNYYERVSRTPFFPVRNAIDAQLFYNARVTDKKAQYLKNSSLSLSTDTIIPSLYNEIYADYFGPIRVGVGLLVSAGTGKKITDTAGNTYVDTSSMQKNAIQRLENSGGNVSISGSFPLFGYLTNDESFGINLCVVPRIALDVPYLGTEKKDYSINANMGPELTLYYTGVLKVITFFAAGRSGFVFGNNLFYDYIDKPDDKPFWLNQVTLGCAFNSTLRISWNAFLGGHFVKDHFPSTVSLSLVLN